MKRIISLSVLVFSTLSILCQDISSIDKKEYSCISESKSKEILKEVKVKRKLYKDRINTQKSFPKLIWPLQMKPNEIFNNYYGVNNFIDHNPEIGDEDWNQFGSSNLDYNCGNRSYDTPQGQFGYNHRGIDISLWPFKWYMVENDLIEVVASASGTIIHKEDGNQDMNCQCQGDWNAVFIMHDDGSVAWYGHLKKNSLTSKSIGASVVQGEPIGIVASSGCSTGPHLHFELYDYQDNLIDPSLGDCNPTTANSLWLDQRDYVEPTVNALLTHSDQPSNDCGDERTYFQNSFDVGDLIYLAVYVKDLELGKNVSIEVFNPSGISEMILTGSPAIKFYPTYWSWWSRYLPSNAEEGIWKMRCTLDGKVTEHFFTYGDVSFVDNDNDGYPEGEDCDDNDSSVYPGAIEICDELDNDCDGEINEGLFVQVYYEDLDDDGFGNDNTGIELCMGVPGLVTQGGDCNDGHPLIYPGAIEILDNGIDEDCDGMDSVTEFEDNDNDGYDTSTDCNDNDSSINPGAIEVCDEVDNDCDGEIDEDLPLQIYYEDIDGDGYGNDGTALQLCIGQLGLVTQGGDCNDTDSTINPGANEVCDEVDNDCDGLIDEGLSFVIYYYDGDGDGYGDEDSSEENCMNVSGFVLIAGDCNDNDPLINPGAIDIPDNGIDENCDGVDAMDGPCSHPDLEGMLALFQSTDGSNWIRNDGWVEGVAGENCDVCDWYGVVCSDGRVKDIILTNNNLNGQLPEAMSQLSRLESLLLSRNSLSGTLPTIIGSWESLQILDLSNNDLFGVLPNELYTLSQLNYLLLQSNEFSGELSSSLSNLNSLKVLAIQSNQFSGNLPTSISALTNLEELYLFNNKFTGSIPDSFGELSKLKNIYAAFNQFEGEIPASLGLINLEKLFLEFNNLSGCIPETILNLCDIEINLENDQLPWNGVVDNFCNGDQQIGASCVIGNKVGMIDENCNCQISSNIESVHSSYVNLYPNPTEDYLILETTQKCFYQVVSILGVVVSEGTCQGESQISLLNQDSGLYYIIIDQSQTYKVVRL